MPDATFSGVAAHPHRETRALLRESDTRAVFARQRVDAVSGTPEVPARRIRGDVTKWRDVIAGVGIRAQ